MNPHLLLSPHESYNFYCKGRGIKTPFVILIYLAILLITNQASGQTTQSFFHTQVQRGMVKSNIGTAVQYNPQSTGTFYVGNASFDQTNRGYIVFNISGIPSNATVTAATLNLRPIQSTGNTSSSTSTILFKNLANRPTAFNTLADWNLLNGVSQFTSLTATVNSNLVISTVALKTKVQNSLGEGFFYFGLVNASEAAKGLSFSMTNADLFLSVTYTVPVPAAPTNLQSSNITTTGCTLTWLKPPGTVSGYRIYRNDVLIQTVTSLSTTVQNLTPNTNYSFKVSAYNIGGESPKSSPVTVTTLPAPVVPIGATFNNPIDIGNLGVCSVYGHGVEVLPGSGYGNEFGNEFDDVFYKFNLTAAADVSLSNCKPDGVSGVLYLLDASGNYVPGGIATQTCDVGNETIYPLQPGVYYVVNESAVSYLTYIKVDIYVKPLVSVSPNVTIAAGSSTTLSASGSTATYTWSPATGLSSTTGATVVASPIVSTLYMVSATSSNGCTESAGIQVMVTGSIGSTFSNPIVANIGGCGFESTLNTAGYGNNYGGPSEDIYFKFTVPAASPVIFDCYANTAAHIVLLNTAGSFIDEQYFDWLDAEDDAASFYWGPVDGTHLNPTLQPGTYYLVAEGTYGNTTLRVGIQTPAGYSCRKAAPQIKGSPSSPDQAATETQLEKTLAPQLESTDMLANGIYPNPASHYVSLNLQQDGAAVIHIVNTNGITVKETIAEKSAELNISDLPAGLYLVKIIQQNKVRSEKMLIKR